MYEENSLFIIFRDMYVQKRKKKKFTFFLLILSEAFYETHTHVLIRGLKFLWAARFQSSQLNIRKSQLYFRNLNSISENVNCLVCCLYVYFRKFNWKFRNNFLEIEFWFSIIQLRIILNYCQILLRFSGIKLKNV